MAPAVRGQIFADPDFRTSRRRKSGPMLSEPISGGRVSPLYCGPLGDTNRPLVALCSALGSGPVLGELVAASVTPLGPAPVYLHEQAGAQEDIARGHVALASPARNDDGLRHANRREREGLQGVRLA